MPKDNDKKSESNPKTTRNGNKLFEGAKDGKPFVKGVPKTPEQKKAISDGMHEAFARKKAYVELFTKITASLGIRIDDDNISTKDLIDALKTVIEALGDKVNKQEIIGDLGLEKVFITPKEAKETDKHIDDFIDNEFK